jgi:hypothetical protein
MSAGTSETGRLGPVFAEGRGRWASRYVVFYGDALVLARGNTLADLHTGRSAGGAPVAAAIVTSVALILKYRGRRNNRSQLVASTAEDLASRQTDNWMVELSAVAEIRLTKHHSVSGSRRLVITAGGPVRRVVYDRPMIHDTVRSLVGPIFGGRFVSEVG